MTAELPSFVQNLAIGSVLAIIFYLTVRTMLANNRETINTLLEENKNQREEFTKVITNHLAHETVAMTHLADVVERLDKNVRQIPEVLGIIIKKVGKRNTAKAKS